MTISERLFVMMRERGISMPELSRMTGISRHTIFDWQKKNTNPGADKIMVICEALQVTPEELLLGKPAAEAFDASRDSDVLESTEAMGTTGASGAEGTLPASEVVEGFEASGTEENAESGKEYLLGELDLQIMQGCRELSEAKKRRLLAYVSMLQNTKERKGRQPVNE